jgi:hypothetical protein
MPDAQVAYDPTLNFNDQKPMHSLGAIYRHASGKIFRYVKFDNGQGNVASAAGRAAYWKDYATAVVTSDKTDSQAGAGIPSGCAGAFQGVVTDGYYTWLQVGGPMTLRLSGTGAVGNKIHAPAADTDLTFTTVADASAAAGAIPAPRIATQMVAGDGNADALCELLLVA